MSSDIVKRLRDCADDQTKFVRNKLLNLADEFQIELSRLNNLAQEGRRAALEETLAIRVFDRTPDDNDYQKGWRDGQIDYRRKIRALIPQEQGEKGK